MTMTDFLTEAQGPGTGVSPRTRGAGGNTPRRLIPSRFQRTAASGDSDDWTGSLVRVALVLAISAAASLGTGLALDHSAGRAVVMAPVDLPAPAADVRGVANMTRDPGAGTDHRTHRQPREPSELFE
ncbi:MAG TPA: hypothetical protein VJS45_04730 [Acidimicrobiia bacterium]|nr:hypothetical protein [Acidimicrobiia bacterium]